MRAIAWALSLCLLPVLAQAHDEATDPQFRALFALSSCLAENGDPQMCITVPEQACADAIDAGGMGDLLDADVACQSPVIEAWRSSVQTANFAARGAIVSMEEAARRGGLINDRQMPFLEPYLISVETWEVAAMAECGLRAAEELFQSGDRGAADSVEVTCRIAAYVDRIARLRRLGERLD